MINPNDLCVLSDVRAWLDSQPSQVNYAQVVAGGVGYTHITITAMSLDGNGTGATFSGTLVGGILTGINTVTKGKDYTQAPLLVASGDGAGALAVAYINDDVLLGGLSPTASVPAPPPGLITRASQMFLNLTNRPGGVLPLSLVERRNGNGQPSICPYNWPIISVTEVLINGGTVAASPDGVQAGYVNDAYEISIVAGTGFPTRYLSQGGGIFCAGKQNITLGYSFGWTSIPYDISQAVIELVSQKYRRRQHIDQDSQKQGDQTVSFSKKDIPPEVLDIVNQYKIKAIIE